ncbi:tyrosine-type recombinase/integrase [Ideonella livida]|uniref:Tyrosine-type recombinase/integrase n=1 Tax=Ideonella livida TaxID=2707176 RepID=A0A7C9TM31_9BURK|nr:tyrosine-type recombinase/integrase [Ideonella livida]NDY93618.1 tyrosine-type recombinase/integrase [Ideonella livida]
MNDPVTWLGAPRQAAQQWLKADEVTAYAEHSIAQYAAMVGQLADWLHGQRERHLLDARTVDLDAFLQGLQGRGGKPASVATLKRYRSLMGSLFRHLQVSGLRSTDPTQGLRPLEGRLVSTERQAPRLLSAAQCEAYLRWVMAEPEANWYELRDKLLRCLYLGTGITVSESRALQLQDVQPADAPQWLRIRHAGPARHIPLPTWCQEVLERWLPVRHKLEGTGSLLLPTRRRAPLAGTRGRSTAPDDDPAAPLGQPARTAHDALPRPISTSEIYEIVRPAMQAAGFDDEQQGPQTLRNSFAARQLLAGTDDEVLQDWMGLRTRFTLDALRRELDAQSQRTAQRRPV